MKRLAMTVTWLGAFAVGVTMRLSNPAIVVVLSATYAVLSFYAAALLRRMADVRTERDGYRDAYAELAGRSTVITTQAMLAGDRTLMEHLVQICREAGADIDYISLADVNDPHRLDLLARGEEES